MSNDLGGGVWVSQSPIWQTNSLLAEAAGEVLLCDPAYLDAELRAIREDVSRRGPSHVQLLLTHADYDHTCGIPTFPEATVVVGETTRRRIESGEAAAALAEQSAEWGTTWGTGLRVDRVVGPGRISCGAFHVDVLDAPGHQVDGLAFVLPDQGVLLPGDYLSAITYAFVVGQLADARRTCGLLLEALDAHRPRLVVPGHGPVMDAARAREICIEDISYLDRLADAAAEARARQLPAAPALLHVYAIEPPRPNTDDFEVYGLRAFNARQALAQC
jgi:glyoxylase-like metal-dependent hydrolase (beta-lactamase superfamily II)